MVPRRGTRLSVSRVWNSSARCSRVGGGVLFRLPGPPVALGIIVGGAATFNLSQYMPLPFMLACASWGVPINSATESTHSRNV